MFSTAWSWNHDGNWAQTASAAGPSGANSTLACASACLEHLRRHLDAARLDLLADELVQDRQGEPVVGELHGDGALAARTDHGRTVGRCDVGLELVVVDVGLEVVLELGPRDADAVHGGGVGTHLRAAGREHDQCERAGDETEARSAGTKAGGAVHAEEVTGSIGRSCCRKSTRKRGRIGAPRQRHDQLAGVLLVDRLAGQPAQSHGLAGLQLEGRQPGLGAGDGHVAQADAVALGPQAGHHEQGLRRVGDRAVAVDPLRGDVVDLAVGRDRRPGAGRPPGAAPPSARTPSGGGRRPARRA